MRSDEATIRFDPVTQAHLPLLSRWLREPHIQKWWGDPGEELSFIRDMIAGRDTTRPFVIVLDGTPVGYIQCWFVGHHQNAEWVRDHPWLTALPPDSVGVDLSIGDPTKLSQGIGSAALGAFARKLTDEGFATIIIDPDPDNTRAVRAYMKAGFRPVPHLQGRTSGMLLMQYVSNAHETTT